MTYTKIIRRAFFIVLCFVLCCLPLKFGISYGVFFLGLLWILDLDYKSKWNTLRQRKLWVPLAIMMGYYLVHLISMIYTSNIEIGWFVLQKKLLFIIAPIVILTIPEEIRTKRHLDILIWSFVAGCFIVMAYSLINSYMNFNESGNSAWFYYCLVSPFQHPSYMAMYIVFSLASLGLMMKDKDWKDHSTGIVISVVYTIIAVSYLFLLQSKSGYLSIILLIVFYIGYSIFSKQYKMLFYSILISVLALLSFTAIPSVGSRLEESVSDISGSKETNIADARSTSMRLLIWQEAWNIARQHPLFGVGVGDTQDILNQSYENAGMNKARHKQLNAHCQILQTLVTVGIAGLLLLAGIFIYPLFTIKNNLIGSMFIFFILLVGLNILVESMWETIAGVSFFTIFYSILASYRFVSRQ